MSKQPSAVSATTDTSGGYVELASPVSGGTITSPFGYRAAPTAGASTYHKGVDIAVPQGTTVSAPASGTVEYAGKASGYGNEIKIQHDDGTETVYGHLSEIDVTAGQQVVAGEIIAKTGGTPGTTGAGTSTGAHLHYEVIQNGQQVNPLSRTSIKSGTTAKATAAASSSTTASAAAVETLKYNQDDVLKSLISGDHFKDNAVNDYDNLTYHWRFFMTADQQVINADTTTTNATLDTFYKKLAQMDQVTIAESGVTSYSIDEVTMQANVGTNFQIESTKFTSIEMKITEPNGVNFLDSLRNAGIQLGIRNYQKCFYYLELSFKGYNQDGTINLKPFDTVIPNGGRWVWTVALSDIQVNLSAGGGTYTLSMTPLTDTLLTGTYNLIPTTIHPSGGTIGEFFDNLCTQLNNVWATIKGDPGIIKYSTKFHPVKDLLTADQVRAMTITPKEEDLNPISGFEFVKNTNTAFISQGFTISRILDSVMKSCEKAQDLAKDSTVDVQQVNDSATKINAKGYRQSVLWRMEPEVFLPNYDPLYNEYYQHVVLHIYGFRHHAAVLSPQDKTNDATIQKAILADMAARGFLPKKYEYLFTGNNSEVIDMDLSYNLKWQALLPTLASNSLESAAPYARVDPKATAPVNAVSQKNRPQDAASTTTNTSPTTTQSGDQVASLQTATSSNLIALNNAYDKAAQASLADPTNMELKQAAQDAQAKFQAAQAASKSQLALTHETRAQLTAARPATIPQTNMGRTFGEDLTNQLTDFTEQQRKEAYPITVQTYNPSDNNGMFGEYHNGKSIYGAVLNQVYGPLATQFFKVSITVKGDPFWIGAGSFEEAVYRQNDLFDANLPNFPEGVNCFLFKMKYPLGQDDNGDIILHTNESVTGVYSVNTITHRFVDGNFTQVLDAYRVPIIDLYKSLYSALYGNPDTASSSQNQPTAGGTT